MPREFAKYLLPLLLLALGCSPSTAGEGDGGTTGGDGGGTVSSDGGTVKHDAGNVVVTGDGGGVARDDAGNVVVTGDGGVVVRDDAGNVVVMGDGGVVVASDGGGVADTGPGPWTLLGFSSSDNADGGSLVELRSIDPVTGASAPVKVESQMTWMQTGANAYAPGLRRIHVIGGATADLATHLFTVDAVNGSLVSSPVMEQASPASPDGGSAMDFNWSGGLGVRSDGTLVGLTWWQGSDAGAEQVRSIDPATGATTLLGSAPGLEWLAYGGSAFDPVRDVFYVIGSSTADPRDRFFTVDAKTGAVLSSPLLDTAASPDGGFASWIAGFHTRSDGTIVGICAQDTAELRSVNPATGKSTVIKPLQGLWVMSGEAVLDRARDVLWVIGGFGQETALRIVGIDAMTGELVASPVLDAVGGLPDGGTPRSWAGGLYVVR